MKLDVREQNMPRELYSLIHNKNGLVAFYLAKGEVKIGAGKDAENILDTISKLVDKINGSLAEPIILFEDKLGIRRGS